MPRLREKITAQEYLAWSERRLAAAFRWKKPKPKKRIFKREIHARYALFYLPEFCFEHNDKPQTRMLNLNNWVDRDFAQDMANGYAVMRQDNQAQLLPTFFTNHP